MAATSVGQIGLDLVVNQKQFNKQMAGIKSSAVKAGAALAAAFAVKKLVDFGKEAIKLGSDLQEVQNVVDTVFPNMTRQVNNFAQNAITSAGLSERMAKQFTGLYGSMAKAFGFSEKAAYDMSTTLTALSGDVASFYNMNADEAYTKLKAVFSGETETLKDLGIVMTQSALDAYAMAEGYGKVTAQMSEAEKVSLRYMFVQDRLAAAQGDFVRTSGSWANQTRVLALQFDALKASIGQGLINILTPVVRLLNVLLGKLAAVAKSFASFTQMITGVKQKSGGSISSTVDDTGALTDNLGAAGAAAKKTAKELKGLAGFDELNLLSSTPSAATGAGSGGAVDFGDMDFGDQVAEQEVKSNAALDKLKNRLKELVNLFKEGFKAGLGDDFSERIETLKENIRGIGDAFLSISTDPKVQKSFNTMLDKITLSLGKTAGSFISIGTSAAINLTGGLKKYLEKDAPFIKDRLVGIFDNIGESHEISGNLAQAVANIITHQESEIAQQATANLIGIYSNTFLGLMELGARFGRDLTNLIAKPIIDNQEKIKEALTNTVKPLATITGAINDFVKNTFGKVFEVYDSKIRPAFEGITQGTSDLFGTILDTYNTYIAPAIQAFADKFDVLVKEHLQPLMDQVIDLFGNIAEAVGAFYTGYLVPLGQWFMETIVPVVMPILQQFGEVFMDIIGRVIDILKGLFEILNGVIEFLVGVFTGDWQKAWGGLQKIFEGVWNAIAAFVGFIWDSIVGAIEIAIEAIKGVIVGTLEVIKETIKSTLETIKTVFTTAWEAIKAFFANAADNIKNKAISTFTNMRTEISTRVTGIKNTIVNGFNAAVNFIKSLPGKALTWGRDIINGLVNGIKGAIGKVKDAVSDIAETIRSYIHFSVPDVGPLTDYESYMPDMIDGLTKTMQKAAPSLYRQVQTIAGNISNGLQPKLALAGTDFVARNTPQLALAGSGGSAVPMAASYMDYNQNGKIGNSGNSGITLAELRALLLELIDLLDLDVVVKMNDRELYKAVKEVHNKEAKATGKPRW